MNNYRGLFVGLTTVDIQCFVEKFPLPNEKKKIAVPEVLVGGPATNAAVAFSFLNGESSLASPVGVNPFTKFIIDDFSNVEIDFADIVEGESFAPILATVITSGNGERSILSHNPGKVNSVISPKELIDKKRPEVLLVDGFYPEFSIECAQICSNLSIPVVADCGSWKPQYNEMLKYVDIAICSSDFLPPGSNNSDDVFQFVRKLGVAKIAISRGGKNILYEDNKERCEVIVQKTKIIDTLGAGDFLHGAFCYYMLDCNSFGEALSKAAVLATLSCSEKGTRKWLNTAISLK